MTFLFPGETHCPSLGRAVLDRVLAGAHGLGLTDLDHQQLAKLRAEPEQRSQPAALTA